MALPPSPITHPSPEPAEKARRPISSSRKKKSPAVRTPMDPRARTTSFAMGNRVYEDVQPLYQWVPGDKEDILTVDLTGFKNEAEFKKEHLKIQIDNYGNLKVSGERPLGGSRWSRFQRILHLAEDCDASGIRATFDYGVLTVVMPKLVRQKPPPPAPQAAAAAAQKPPAAAPVAAPTPAPAPAPAKESVTAPTGKESKLPPPPPYAPDVPDALRRTEERSSGGKTVPEKAPAAGKKGAEPSAEIPERMPSAPAPAEKATPHIRKQPTAAAAVTEEEKPRLGTGILDLGGRPRQLLVNVVVAVLVLVGLGFYLIYRYTRSPDDQEPPF